MKYSQLLLVFFIFFVKTHGQIYRGLVDHIIKDNLLIPTDVVQDTKRFIEEYDFIVVGSGSSGSVIANRLTENYNWTVLLLEAGPEESILTDFPLFVSHLVTSDYNWGYTTEKSDSICRGMKNQRCNWPRGKVMGGTSVINYMVYTRGIPQDYDGWAKLGNEGWSYKDVLPYFKKSEDIRVSELKNSPYHGVGGYLKIEHPAWRTPMASLFLEAGRELGYSTVDHSAENIGFSYVLANTGNGARFSASKAFLRPIRHRPNLKVSKNSMVTKILFSPHNKKAVGVQFQKKSKMYTVHARKEVVVCAGALNSPQLLMLSGIGPREHLEEQGIPVIQDLKVGHNLQDHVSMAGLVFLVNDTVTIVEREFLKPTYMFNYLFYRKGPLTSPGGAESLAFIPSKYEVDKSRPDIELVFGPGALTGDSGGSLASLLGISEKFYKKLYAPFFERQAYNIVPLILRPYSRGFVKLRTTNPFDSPKFYPNYLSDPRDMNVLVDAIKKVSVYNFHSIFSLFVYCKS